MEDIQSGKSLKMYAKHHGQSFRILHIKELRPHASIQARVANGGIAEIGRTAVYWIPPLFLGLTHETIWVASRERVE